MGEEVRGEDYLHIVWDTACWRVWVNTITGKFSYTGLLQGDVDASFKGSPWRGDTLILTPLPGKEKLCRQFAARINLKHPGVTVIVVGGEDAE